MRAFARAEGPSQSCSWVADAEVASQTGRWLHFPCSMWGFDDRHQSGMMSHMSTSPNKQQVALCSHSSQIEHQPAVQILDVVRTRKIKTLLALGARYIESG